MSDETPPQRYDLLMNCARATALCLAIGCGSESTGPAKPTSAQRAETAASVDKAGGYVDYRLGRHIDEVIKLGLPSSKQYMPDGLVLSVYRKDNIKEKIGEVTFTNITLYFGRTEELQMFRFSEAASAADCETVRTKLSDMYGMADPIEKGAYRWLGHELYATWKHSSVRGTSTCSVEFRATKMR